MTQQLHGANLHDLGKDYLVELARMRRVLARRIRTFRQRTGARGGSTRRASFYFTLPRMTVAALERRAEELFAIASEPPAARFGSTTQFDEAYRDSVRRHAEVAAMAAWIHRMRGGV